MRHCPVHSSNKCHYIACCRFSTGPSGADLELGPSGAEEGKPNEGTVRMKKGMGGLEFVLAGCKAAVRGTVCMGGGCVRKPDPLLVIGCLITRICF